MHHFGEKVVIVSWMQALGAQQRHILHSFKNTF